MFVRTNEMARPTHQPSGVRFRRTSALILSVTEPTGCPGSTAAGVVWMRVSSYGSSNLSIKTLRLSLPLDRRERLVRVAHGGQIPGARPRVQVAEQVVAPLLRVKPGDLAVRVVEVAEDDGLGRAGLLAGRDDVAVLHPLALLLALDLRVLDALDAVAALLHHAARAHADFRVAHHLEVRRVPPVSGHRREEEEVEAPNLVRAVVRAVARADAAVVDHLVEALGAVHRGVDGADALARRVLAVHAGDGHEVDARGAFDRAAEVCVNPEPVHLARARDLLFADDGDVVLGLAGDDAGVAADARRDINRHAPAIAAQPLLIVLRVIEGRVERFILFRMSVLARRFGRLLLALARRGERRVARPFGVGSVADDLAPLHTEVNLRAGQRVLFARLPDAEARRGPQRVGGAQLVGVEAEHGLVVQISADAARTPAPVAEMNRDDTVGLARQDEDGDGFFRRAPLQGEPEDFGAHLAALGRDAVDALGRVPGGRAVGRVADAERFRRGRADDGDVVPGELRQGLRQLLKPAVVGEATVVDGRVCAEDYLEVARAAARQRRGRAARRRR